MEYWSPGDDRCSLPRHPRHRPTNEKFTYWDQLFDVGLRGEMGNIGDYFKTWNWELGFRYSRNEGQDLSVGEVSQPGLRDALLDTDPARRLIRSVVSSPKYGRGQRQRLCDAA